MTEQEYCENLRKAAAHVLNADNKYDLNDALDALWRAYHPKIRVKMGRLAA